MIWMEVLRCVMFMRIVSSSYRDANWAGNIKYSAHMQHYNSSVADVVKIVSTSDRVKVCGTRHSFSGVCDTSGALIFTSKLNNIISMDHTSVTIEPGVTYGQLGEYLYSYGRALRNYASLPHISVAGAVSTATHGSGVANALLANDVLSLDLVFANGTIITIQRNDTELYSLILLSMGTLGAFIRLTLQHVPEFEVMQCRYSINSPDGLNSSFEEILYSDIFQKSYSVNLYTAWIPGSHPDMLWVKSRRGDGNSLWFPGKSCPQNILKGLGVLLPGQGLRSSPRGDIEASTKVGVGPSHLRLPHFDLHRPPSAGGDELQSEYFVNFDVAVEAFRAILSIRDVFLPYVWATEIRVIKSDEFVLSPCQRSAQYHKEECSASNGEFYLKNATPTPVTVFSCVCFHFTWMNSQAPGGPNSIFAIAVHTERRRAEGSL